MNNPLNPQAEQMADASMIRALAAQAEAVWPQEQRLFERYGLSGPIHVLDIGCGTGEGTARIAALYPEAQVLGVDLEAGHLARARMRCAAFGDRVRFETGDAFALDVPDDAVDLTVCRHMIQAVPYPERVVAEMVRVTRAGGRLHLIAEDYGLVQASPTRRDVDVFWRNGPVAFGEAVGTDMRVGRRAFSMLTGLGVRGITVDYLPVDTLRVPREILTAIFEAWRDGFTDAIAAHSTLTKDDLLDYWADMLDCIHNPNGYLVWHVPVFSGIVP